MIHEIRDDDASITSKPDEQTYLQRHGDDHVTSEVIIHMMILVPRSIEEVAGAQEIRFLEIANKLACRVECSIWMCFRMMGPKMVTFSGYPTPPKHMKHAIGTRCIGSHSHFPHTFQSSFDCVSFNILLRF